MPFRFLDLPGEIRNAIYSSLYLHPRVIFPFRYATRGQHPDCFRSWQPPPVLRFEFLLTCRQIHDEASVILYGRNTFRFAGEGLRSHEGHYSCVRHFMETIGRDNRRRVRHVELALDTHDQWQDAFLSREWMFCEEPDRLEIALAVLATCFPLGTLTVTFFYNLLKYEFTFVLDDSITTGRKAILRQMMLELAATIKAFKRCHHLPLS